VLLDHFLAIQIHAEVVVDYDPDGLRVTVGIPLDPPDRGNPRIDMRGG
jgi:hypothetical protein